MGDIRSCIDFYHFGDVLFRFSSIKEFFWVIFTSNCVKSNQDPDHHILSEIGSCGGHQNGRGLTTFHHIKTCIFIRTFSSFSSIGFHLTVPFINNLASVISYGSLSKTVKRRTCCDITKRGVASRDNCLDFLHKPRKPQKFFFFLFSQETTFG